MALLAWALCIYGVTVIVTRSKLFFWLRRRLPAASKDVPLNARTWFGTLLNCPLCFGWWVGAGLDLLGFSPIGAIDAGDASRLLHVVLSGAAAAAVAWTWYVILAKLGSDTL